MDSLACIFQKLVEIRWIPQKQRLKSGCTRKVGKLFGQIIDIQISNLT